MFTTRANQLMRTSDLATEMDRVFHQLFAGGSPRRLVDVPAFSSRNPATDIIETEESFLIETEVPGFSMEQIDITLTGGELTISGNRAEETEEMVEAEHHRKERRSAQFRRSFTFPIALDSENVTAQLADGVLSITLPKAPELKPRKIEVVSS